MSPITRQLLLTGLMAIFNESPESDIKSVIKNMAANVGAAKLKKLADEADAELKSEDALAAEQADKLAGGTKANRGKGAAKPAPSTASTDDTAKPATTRKKKLTKDEVREIAKKVSDEDPDELKAIFKDQKVKNITDMPTAKYQAVFDACSEYLTNLLGDDDNYDNEDADEDDLLA